jgi:hypothetical protein
MSRDGDSQSATETVTSDQPVGKEVYYGLLALNASSSPRILF